MGSQYLLGIDQSTKATKALLLDESGQMIKRVDISHRQIISELGWIEHDPEEIMLNTEQAVKRLLDESKIDRSLIKAVGISNQRETAVVWDRTSGKPVYNAIVWQCARAEQICNEIAAQGCGGAIKQKTGLNLSPYFTAAKLAWILRNCPGVQEMSDRGDIYCGTVDSWLVYHLSKERAFKTDYSNAARTQLFNIITLEWDFEICNIFGINPENLAEVCYSDSNFGVTDLFGLLTTPIPIHGVIGDSNGALFAQGCLDKGMVKCTYGTGSSIMMNIGKQPQISNNLATSLAWGREGKVEYVTEGNINYAGAVISWLKESMRLIHSEKELSEMHLETINVDQTYFVPAFSGLGAPYWDSEARGIFCGIMRNTGKKELIRAAEESIAYQVADIVFQMKEDTKVNIVEIRADGGPTKDRFLMQFQSDILDIKIAVSQLEEQSGIGASYIAGVAIGIFSTAQLQEKHYDDVYYPRIEQSERAKKYGGWKDAVRLVLRK